MVVEDGDRFYQGDSSLVRRLRLERSKMHNLRLLDGFLGV